MRRPHAHHPRGLGHVYRGDPVEDPLMLFIVDNLRLDHRGLLNS
jgi:hypothetical protein